MLSSHTVGFQWPDNSNLANLTPGMCRSSWSWSNTSPGGRSSMQQDIFDRHQFTVCNTRSKVRIATWNVRTMRQSGKLERIKR